MRNGISATATGLALQHSYASWRQQCINARPDPKITLRRKTDCKTLMTPTSFQVHRAKRNPIKQWLAALFLLSVFGGLLLFLHSSPLQSDEKMIAHFYAHRAEIEELVKRYRKWEPSTQIPVWHFVPENKALLEKAKVKRVKDLIPVWPPTPYSAEATKQFSALIRAGKIKNVIPYSSIGVELVDEQRPDKYSGFVLISAGWQRIFKELVYFPEIPKIEQGELIFPADSTGRWRHTRRVFPTLNDYPPDWKKGECVYRQFETQWFIYMCITY